MGIKEIMVLIAVLMVGYYLGTNDMLQRFIPSGA